MQKCVIHVCLDDLGAEQVGTEMRNGLMPGLPLTPFLDSLFLDGLSLNAYYSEAFCSPSRTRHLSGRTTEDTGVGNIIETTATQGMLDNEYTIAEAIKSYYGKDAWTACFGKWHLGFNATDGALTPNKQGFDHFYGTEKNMLSYYDATLIRQGVSSQSSGQYVPLLLIDAAIVWIKRFAASSATKGYLYVPLHLPHEPYARPPSSLYTDSLWHCEDAAPSSQSGPDVIPYSKAMVETMDRLLQRLWDAVPLALKADTVLIVSSDNGTAPTSAILETYPDGTPIQNDHVKRSQFDPGVRVPAYIYGSRVVLPGRRITGLVQPEDWYATTLDILGVPWPDLVEEHGPEGIPATARSHSLLANIDSAVLTTQRPYVINRIFGPNGYNRGTAIGKGMITDGRYKLMFDGDAFVEPSFQDLQVDPKESIPTEIVTADQVAAQKELQAVWDCFYDELPAMP